MNADIRGPSWQIPAYMDTARMLLYNILINRVILVITNI